MTYDVRQRLDYLRIRMRPINGGLVTVRRVGQPDLSNVPATIYELKSEELMMLGVSAVDEKRRDYIINSSDFGNLVEPALGDIIIDGNLVCTVAGLGSNEPHFKYTNSLRNEFRIHTVLTGFSFPQIPI